MRSPSPESRLPRHWAHRPAALSIWLIGLCILAASLWFGWPVFKAVQKMWTVLTWDGPGPPPGPPTIIFFIFPFVLMVAAAILAAGLGAAIASHVIATQLWRGWRPNILVPVALAALLLPPSYAVGRALFFAEGQLAMPTPAQLHHAISPAGLRYAAPALLTATAIVLLCLLRRQPAEG